MRRLPFLASAVLSLALMVQSPLLPAREVTLRFAGFDSPQRQQEMERKFREFEARNPGIKVVYEAVQDDISGDLAAGTAQDVFLEQLDWARTAMKRELLLPLGRYMKRGVTRPGDFLPTLIEGLSYKGEIYGIPISFEVLALFYNKEMFDAASLAHPNPNWTWDDLRSAARKLTKSSLNPSENQYGISFGLNPDALQYGVYINLKALSVMALIIQAGGSLLNEKDEPILQVEPTVRAFDFLAGFYKDRTVLPSGLEGVSWEEGGPLAKRRVAMVIDRARSLGTILTTRAPGLQYGVTELPKGPEGRGNVYSEVVAYFASKKTRNPEEAWRLIEYLTSAEIQLKDVKSGSGLPTRAALKDDETIARRPEAAVIYNSLAYAKSDYYGEHPEQAWSIVWDALWGVLKGWTTTKDAVSQAVKDLARVGR